MTSSSDILHGKILIVGDQKDNVLLLDALQAGAREFISKPFDLAEVLARIRNMMEVRLMHVDVKNCIKALEQKIQEVKTGRDPKRTHRDAGCGTGICRKRSAKSK
jgi:DNA-binding response OmpR family regulator